MLLLTRIRKEKGLSKSALARKAGMHPSSVCQIENKRLAAYPGQAAKLSSALGWQGDPADLFKEVEEDAAAACE